ncbi:MAG: hypothetical protein HYX80_04735 [Chloroflexi bacterium]|nr:hypothetical protein [Chloroflexota bacterium]
MDSPVKPENDRTMLLLVVLGCKPEWGILMKPIIVSGLLMASLVTWLIGGQSSGGSFDARLSSVVKPYRFSIAGWEMKTIGGEAGRWLFSWQARLSESGKDDGQSKSDDEVGVVTGYFDTSKRISELKSELAAANAGNQEIVPARLDELRNLQERRAAQAAEVEKIIKKQIGETLAGQGIFNPGVGLRVSFPPVNFRLEELPNVLVISPRDKIESMREVVLKQKLTIEEKEAIEAGADNLGVSSLVTGIGGMATYPTLVDSETSLRAAIDTATHEWLHQYLAFTPLGFRYVLDVAGVSRNYEITTMNESVANLAGKEIGDIVYAKYYAKYESGTKQAAKPEFDKAHSKEFDFNQEMRNIRETVDAYLARGEIGPAEAFMEQKRQELASKGYYIRKLNQAYFAFHGSYADSPAFLNPIGLELKELRSRSASLKDFLHKTARMSNRQDLTESLK